MEGSEVSAVAELNRSLLALALGAAAFAAVLAGSLALVGAAGGDPVGDDSVPYAGFEFEETTVEVEVGNGPGDGASSRRAVRMAFRGGGDLPRGEVVVWVNGDRGWDVNDRNRTVPVWNGSAGRLSDGPARVVAAGGDAERDDPADAAATAPPPGSGGLRPIEAGDVIEVVWIEPGGDRASVLQRYVVGE